jgi:uncharacterized protein (DUF433 family)
MNLKQKRTPWQNHDVHRESTRIRLRLEDWGCSPKVHAVVYGEEATAADGGYTEALLKVFGDAMTRCRSSISIDPYIMEGQPCIAGTRIPVRSVLRAIEHYGSIKEAIKCYPGLTSQQVQDALFFSQVILELPSGIDKPALAS